MAASDDNDFDRADDATQVLAAEPAPAEGEWPVSELYRVDPDDPPVDALSEETVVVASGDEPPPQRRVFPSEVGRGLLLASAAVILAIAVAALISTRDADTDDPDAAGTPTQPTTSAPTATTPAVSSSRQDVPDLSGLGLAEARRTLEDAGFRVRVVRRPSDRPANEVLAQDPRAGTPLAEGELVVVTVARKGQPATAEIATPEVVGLRVSEASELLREAGLRVEIVLVSSDEAVGTVLRQSPDAGAELDEGSIVRLDVAKATRPAVERVDLPDTVGTDVGDARSRLRELGLRVRIVRVVAAEPAGTVVRQSPSSGASVREGSTVTLRVSTGPAEIAVPDVVGLDEAAARLELESAGFQVRVTDQPTTDPAEDGLVVSQSPQSGATARDGAIVTLTVARLG